MQSSALISGVIAFEDDVFKMAYPFIEDTGSYVVRIIGVICMTVGDGDAINNAFRTDL